MERAIISSNMTIACFTLIVLYGTLRQAGQRRMATKLFALVLLCEFVAAIVDAQCYIFDGDAYSEGLILFVHLMSYLLAVVMLFLFAFYMLALFQEQVQVSFKKGIPVLVLSVINFVQLLVSFFMGKLFVMENHDCRLGEWEPISSLFSTVILLYLYYLLIRYRKSVEQRSFFALFSYMLIPVLLVIYQLIQPDAPDFTYAASGISFLYIFVEIQSRMVMEADVREKILGEESYRDAMTGLKNRRAYEEILRREMSGNTVGIVFCDINGLKYVNDHFGHESGDHLIMRFANILSTEFSDGDVCRISGDEFVVMIYGLTEYQMQMRMQRLRKQIDRNNRIASFGFVHRKCEALLGMVRDAERNMYEDKERYYRETGKERRK